MEIMICLVLSLSSLSLTFVCYSLQDLSKLGRELRSCIIVDNSPHSYAFHPYNAIAIETWFDDPNDTQLYELQAFLESLIDVEDVATVLDATRTMQ